MSPLSQGHRAPRPPHPLQEGPLFRPDSVRGEGSGGKGGQRTGAGSTTCSSSSRHTRNSPRDTTPDFGDYPEGEERLRHARRGLLHRTAKSRGEQQVAFMENLLFGDVPWGSMVVKNQGVNAAEISHRSIPVGSRCGMFRFTLPFSSFPMHCQ